MAREVRNPFPNLSEDFEDGDIEARIPEGWESLGWTPEDEARFEEAQAEYNPSDDAEEVWDYYPQFEDME